MSLLDILTGGKSGEASDAEKQALAALQKVQTPTAQALTLPELQQYTISQNMTPAQMQAFLQENNAFANQNIDQTGTDAQKAAISRLLEEANAGPEGSATNKAQQAEIQQDAARNLAGQRGAIDQQAQARGVPPGLLAAALQSQRAGEGQQDAHIAALQARSGNYQQALNALAQGGALGSNLQGRQNTQANTVAQAQNAMQQFNAANQQVASGTNAGFRQTANAQNTQNANQTGAANTGLANERTKYNANVPQQVFQNEMQKAGGVANQYGQIANNASQQGEQNAGIYSGLIGAGATVFGGPLGGLAANQAMSGSQAVGNGYGSTPTGANADPRRYGVQMAEGGMVEGCDMKSGGPVPGHAKVLGDSTQNDTVHAKLSPGEYVVPRSIVQNHPEDIATLLAAMRHLRGSK